MEPSDEDECEDCQSGHAEMGWDEVRDGEELTGCVGLEGGPSRPPTSDCTNITSDQITNIVCYTLSGLSQIERT